MINELKLFEKENLGSIRVMMINDEPWFIASDLCSALDLGNTAMMVDRLDDDERGTCVIDSNGGPQVTNIVNEPGLYSLIMTSRKPEAKYFKRWVTHEVLPQIRKTGSYSATSLDESYVRAAEIISRADESQTELVVKMLRKAGLDVPETKTPKPKKLKTDDEPDFTIANILMDGYNKFGSNYLRSISDMAYLALEQVKSFADQVAVPDTLDAYHIRKADQRYRMWIAASNGTREE